MRPQPNEVEGATPGEVASAIPDEIKSVTDYDDDDDTPASCCSVPASGYGGSIPFDEYSVPGDDAPVPSEDALAPGDDARAFADDFPSSRRLPAFSSSVSWLCTR